MIDTNKLLRQHNYHRVDNFPEIARRAASLSKSGLSRNRILSQIKKEFGVLEFLELSEKPGEFAMFGRLGVNFEYNVIKQMNMASRLPVYVKGALMPDAHVGYALPIGGVAALYKAVSPYMVGVDIGCRMQLTILDMQPDEMIKHRESILDDLESVTKFGPTEFSDPLDHPVMDHPLWKNRNLPIYKLKGKAHRQLGTSGGGNHFADLVVGTVRKQLSWLPSQRFAGLLTHSGSRNVGYRVANHYSKIAEEETNKIANGISKEYAWLSTDSEIGQEYLAVMRLMGEYAKANHYLIHNRFLKKTGLTPWNTIQNHHNFAWVEGDLVIHRKGATPAHKGTPGLIPGSSGTNSYLVSGLGNEESLNSCSHGAGRNFSRSQAKREHDQEFFEEWMNSHDIIYRGVAPDETFMAYKDIEEVIDVQDGVLVDVVASMKPVAVLMGSKGEWQ